MFGTFLYLTLCSMRNRMRVRLRRLREPRYLLGSVFGIAYWYYFVFARGFSGSRARRDGLPSSSGTPMAMLARASGPIHFVGALGLMFFAVVAWLWPASRRPIDFTRSEVQFFFPAPFTRRQLLHYKLLRSQLALFFGSAVATVFLRPTSLVSGWTLLVGMWIVLMIFRLHSMGISLSRANLVRNGASGIARQWMPVALVIGSVLVLVSTAWLDWPTLSAFTNPSDAFTELQKIWSTGASAVVLWPFRTVSQLPLSASASEFFRALPGALGILALNYVWVLRADTSFEEAAADRAEKVAALKAAPRTARVKSTPTPFKLAPEGRPEMAILWKNLIMIGRYASAKTLLRLLPMVAAFAAFASSSKSSGMAGVLAGLCLIFIVMVVLTGPQMARNDLRQDLSRLAVLKTWPLSGATLLRGELLAPTVVLSGIAWIFIVAAAFLVQKLPTGDDAVVRLVLQRMSLGIAALLLAPAMILVQLVVQNGIAVLFPAWVAIGGSRARGVDAMGQRLLMMAGILLTLALALLPAAIAAGAVGFGIYAATDVVPIIVPAAVGAAVLVAECAVAVELLGRVLDRTDVGSVEPTE